ncbi:unnamed protein product, partial [marine sediment metagenome]
MINKEKENLQTDKENSDEIEVKVDKKILKEIEEIETKNKRDLTGLWSIPIIVASIGLFIFHMYTGWFGAYFSLIQRSIHFMFILTLTFSLFARGKKTPRDKIQFYDLIFIGISIILCYYILTNYKELVWRAGAANPMDVFLGVVLVLLTLEATRRAVGLPLMLVAAFFLLYALVFGPYMPGRFSHGTFSIKRVAYYLY